MLRAGDRTVRKYIKFISEKTCLNLNTTDVDQVCFKMIQLVKAVLLDLCPHGGSSESSPVAKEKKKHETVERVVSAILLLPGQ